MTTILNKGASKKTSTIKFYSRSTKNNGVDTNKFCGVINYKTDTLKIEKKLTSESIK